MPQHKGIPPGDLAFRRCYEAHYLEVLAYCRRRIGSQAAEDATAGTFTVAWRKWDSVPRGDSALPWPYGVARREVLHQWRSAARYRRLTERIRHLGRPVLSGPDHVVVRAVEAEVARQVLKRLRPRDQEVLRLALWEELTHAEIAVVLEATPKAVGMRFSRAKRRFGDAYRTLERDHPTTPSRLEKGGGQ